MYIAASRTSVSSPMKWAYTVISQGFPGSTSGKEPANAGDMRDMGLVPQLGRSPGVGHGNSLQYSCLENPMDRGAWQAIVHGSHESYATEVTKHNHQSCLPASPRGYYY